MDNDLSCHLEPPCLEEHLQSPNKIPFRNSRAFAFVRCLIASMYQHSHRLKSLLLEEINHRRSHSRLVHHEYTIKT
ncbi:MAG: hypothetical protein WCP70_05920 [Methanothrix sp.]